MTGDDGAFLVDEDRIDEAEPLDRARDLLHLFFRMCARVARVGP